MKQLIMSLSLLLILIGCKKEKEEVTKLETAVIETKAQEGEAIYQFQVTDLYGEDFDFSKLKGKKIMVVNTASECGLTPQYEGLQKLYDSYKEKQRLLYKEALEYYTFQLSISPDNNQVKKTIHKIQRKIRW